jgi:hypothetical protein
LKTNYKKITEKTSVGDKKEIEKENNEQQKHKSTKRNNLWQIFQTVPKKKSNGCFYESVARKYKEKIITEYIAFKGVFLLLILILKIKYFLKNHLYNKFRKKTYYYLINHL